MSRPQPALNPNHSAAEPKSDGHSARPWFKKKRVLIPVGLLCLGAVGSQLGGGDGGTTASAQPTSRPGASAPAQRPERGTAKAVDQQEPAAQGAAGMGTPVRDGQFEFTVSGMTCGATKVGTAYLNEVAQGQFCIAELAVKNIGDSPQLFMSDNQDAFIGETKYASSSTAAIYYATQRGRNGGDWAKEINPGNQLRGALVFDVPKGKKPDRLTLHDSAFSGGIDVALK